VNLYLKILDGIENVILVISMLAMLLITFANVVVRNFTTFSFAFTEELVPPLFILVTLVGAGAVARRGGHLGFSLLIDKLNPKVRLVAVLITAGICIVFSVLIARHGFDLVSTQLQRNMTTPAMRWPQWIFTSFVPIGGALMAVEFFNFAVLAVIGAKKEAKKAKTDTEQEGGE